MAKSNLSNKERKELNRLKKLNGDFIPNSTDESEPIDVKQLELEALEQTVQDLGTLHI